MTRLAGAEPEEHVAHSHRSRPSRRACISTAASEEWLQALSARPWPLLTIHARVSAYKQLARRLADNASGMRACETRRTDHQAYAEVSALTAPRV